ncbi:calcium-binding protein [Rhizobium sp. TH2]|uniref:calcium-binding protein n=1 Tax=Rhizobium sp. TH2 TaxID=2775403 RepID=UPI00215768D1|nr:hypothetical protein [Rhizobium sp. TH2]
MVTKKGTNKNDHLTGTASDDKLFGLEGNDVLKGLNGHDILFGGVGNDTLEGMLGDDELLGEGGNDLFLPGNASSGADAMHGGTGKDTVSYANFATMTGINLTFHSGNEVGAEDAAGDTFQGIENFIGTRSSDFINFHFYNNVLPGFIYGGAGDDIIAGKGNLIRGDAGTDWLYADVNLAKADTIWLQLNKGSDNVINFDSAEDLLRIRGDEFGIGRLLNGNELFNRAADSNATGASAQFIFRQDNDQLYFDGDGTGADAAILIASFSGMSAGQLVQSDFEIV